MSEGNTQLTLHNESVEKIVQLLHAEADITGNPSIRAIANTIDAQRQTEPEEPEERVAVGFCGFPGAGKSYVAEKFGEQYDAEVISMGDAIRNEFMNRFADSASVDTDNIGSEALAEFAAEARDEDAEQIPWWVAELAKERGGGVFAIDGVRSVTDYDVLKSYFDVFVLVEVGAPFPLRLERIQERDREGEGDFERENLLERDLHELDRLGFHGLRTYNDTWAEEYLPDGDQEYNIGAIDWTITNDGRDLTDDLDHIVESTKKLDLKT